MRMRTSLFTGILLSSLFLLQFSPQATAGDYDYPYNDPLLATVLGTPPDQLVPFTPDMPVKVLDLTVFPERKFPGVFWYNQELRASLVYQKKKAPLIFVIAGTGAGFNADTMLALQNIFYRAGFHVVSISSPTQSNFVATGSESMVPGILEDDARDLYRVMEDIWEKIKGDIEVSDFYLTGYSLGGTQAAFVGMLDEEKKSFGFRKVLMINPAVNLYSSTQILDRMLDENIPGGPQNTRQELRKLLDKFAARYRAAHFVKLDQNFLYNIYRGLPEPPSKQELQVLIGFTFRISSSNMIFTSDAMTHTGFVVPRNLNLSSDDPLYDYLITLLYIPFARYVDEYLFPAAQARNPQLTLQMLIDADTLKSIEWYLKRAQKVGVLTNADDIILAPGELDYLRRLFGSRATIFPNGGHLGNIDHRAVADAMTRYFSQP